MYRITGKSELQARLKESYLKYPNLKRQRPREQSASLSKKNAAVALVVAQDLEGEFYFLLTMRSKKLSSHPHQIALPGGMCEAADAGNLLKTLEREVFEEVGLSPQTITWETEAWDLAVSKDGVLVHPFLGFLTHPIDPFLSLQIQKSEVERAEWIKLSQLFDTSLWLTREYQSSDASHVWNMPVWTGWYEETWGLTAVMLHIFMSRISGASPY